VGFGLFRQGVVVAFNADVRVGVWWVGRWLVMGADGTCKWVVGEGRRREGGCMFDWGQTAGFINKRVCWVCEVGWVIFGPKIKMGSGLGLGNGLDLV
jgi:hypothetical protein